MLDVVSVVCTSCWRCLKKVNKALNITSNDHSVCCIPVEKAPCTAPASAMYSCPVQWAVEFQDLCDFYHQWAQAEIRNLLLALPWIFITSLWHQTLSQLLWKTWAGQLLLCDLRTVIHDIVAYSFFPGWNCTLFILLKLCSNIHHMI